MNVRTLRLALNAMPPMLSRAELNPQWFRGIALRVQVAVFEGSSISDLSAVSSLTMSVRLAREDLSSAALMSKTVAAASFTSSTAPQWVAGTHQHATFEFTAAETNVDISGERKKEVYVVFKALLSSGAEVIVGTGIGLIVEGNAGVVGDPPDNPEPGLSADAADARYLRFDGAQDLSEAQQLQGLENLGITLSATTLTLPNGKTIYLNA